MGFSRLVIGIFSSPSAVAQVYMQECGAGWWLFLAVVRPEWGAKLWQASVGFLTRKPKLEKDQCGDSFNSPAFFSRLFCN